MQLNLMQINGQSILMFFSERPFDNSPFLAPQQAASTIHFRTPVPLWTDIFLKCLFLSLTLDLGFSWYINSLLSLFLFLHFLYGVGRSRVEICLLTPAIFPCHLVKFSLLKHTLLSSWLPLRLTDMASTLPPDCSVSFLLNEKSFCLSKNHTPSRLNSTAISVIFPPATCTRNICTATTIRQAQL